MNGPPKVPGKKLPFSNGLTGKSDPNGAFVVAKSPERQPPLEQLTLFEVPMVIGPADAGVTLARATTVATAPRPPRTPTESVREITDMSLFPLNQVAMVERVANARGRSLCGFGQVTTWTVAGGDSGRPLAFDGGFS